MNRPYIFCHMQTSLDGKIMGKYLWLENTTGAEDSFYTIISGPRKQYDFEAIVTGRRTVEDNYTFYESPELDLAAPAVPDGDYIAEGASLGKFYIVLDGSGRVNWPNNTQQEGPETFHVVEILTERASNAYKSFLRDKGISYLICGESTIDLPFACEQIKNKLSINTMMLGGGALINWSFIQSGLVDEISQVIAPAADGNPNTQPLFLANPAFAPDKPVRFKPLSVQIMPDDAVWIRYEVGEIVQYDFDNDPDYKALQDMIRDNQ